MTDKNNFPVIPSKPPFNPEWATYIESRRPQFKVHKRKGDATNALLCHKGGFMYRWNGSEWEPFVGFSKPTHCANCGTEFERYYVFFDPRKNHLEGKAVCKNCIPLFRNTYKYEMVVNGDVRKYEKILTVPAEKKWSELYKDEK